MGYTCIWPDGHKPFFMRPVGQPIYLVVKSFIPYAVPGSEYCKSRKTTGTISFCCASSAVSTDDKPGELGGTNVGACATLKVNSVPLCQEGGAV